MWDSGRTKHLTREICVREPLADNERGAVENVASTRNFLADPSREFSDLLFAIASDNVAGRDCVAKVQKRQA
jgi:hypothetical protein